MQTVPVHIFCFFFLAAFIIGVWVPTHTAAQFAEQNTGISLKSSPAYPEPHQEVTISLNDYSVNTLGADIAWYIDGTEVTESRNERSITLNSGDAGISKTITTQIRHQGVVFSASHIIRPVLFDIILEADTYVPRFYKGRALPSANASMRAVAVIDDGSGISWNTYSYKWTFDNQVLSGGAVKGRYAVNLIAPMWNGDFLTVEVYGENGAIVGKKTIAVDVVQPQLLFYEYSMLRGLRGEAIMGEVALTDNEATYYAEPFFINHINPHAKTTFIWELDAKEIPSNAGIPNAITLRATGVRGKAAISASAATKDNIPQFVRNNFSLIFQ